VLRLEEVPQQTVEDQEASLGDRHVLVVDEEGVLVPRQGLREAARDIDPGSMHVVHNGIEAAEFVGLERGAATAPPTIGFLARLCRDKGVHTLVEAFILLRGRGKVPGVRLGLTGVVLEEDRPLLGELRTRLADACLEGDVSIAENVTREEKHSFLARIDLLSVPATYGESFGLYLLEAMAAGIPVVQPRSGAFPELLEATGGGLLCEPDDPEALSLRLEELLLDGVRREAMGLAGRAAVLERFQLADMARGVEQVCQTLTSVLPTTESARSAS